MLKKATSFKQFYFILNSVPNLLTVFFFPFLLMVWAPKFHILSLHIMGELQDTQKQLSQERNARILQNGILANHLAKQKEKEMANRK